MAKLSLWKQQKGHNYFFNDKIVREQMNIGGTGVYVHKYIGPASGGGETKIDDILLLENRTRKYSDDVYELRGSYMPSATDLSLTQWGYVLQEDTISMMFHYNTMLDIIGRKLMSGDVIELPHKEDPDTLDENAPISYRYYAISDASHANEGYGVTWFSHIWKIKAKQVIASPEYASIKSAKEKEKSYVTEPDLPEFLKSGTIINPNGEIVGEVCCDKTNSTHLIDQHITTGIVDEAYQNVRFDPKFFDAAHLWVEQDDKGRYYAYNWSEDSIPPNGKQISGAGDEFPDLAVEGDFFLRIDYDTPRLFKKEGNIWRLIEPDMRKIWTAYNKILDKFIDNQRTDTMTDGSVVKKKKALSKVVKPKVNLHANKEAEIIANNNGKKG